MWSWLKSLVDNKETSNATTQADVAKLRSARTGTWTNPAFKAPVDRNWELMRAGRYAEAVEAFIVAACEDNWPAHHRNRAIALLCMNRFRDAYDAYEEADQAERIRAPAHNRDLDAMGLCLWLVGDRSAALPLIREHLDLPMKRKLTYGDFAGGASEGLVAYYAGVSLPDIDTKTKALRHLRKIANGKRHRGWPKPIARFLVGDLPLEKVLIEAAEADDIETAINHARVDILSRRQLVEALFYAAIRKRDEGQEAECLGLLAKVADLPISHTEIEWFLAKHEIEQALESNIADQRVR